MIILSKDIKKGLIKLKVTKLDDLWTLYLILKPLDIVKASTTRKIKTNKEDARQKSQNIIKKKLTISIQIEKVSFHQYSDILRVSGTITQAPEDIKKGSHHTLNIELNSILEIQKHWLNFELNKVQEACKQKKSKILICVLEREQACFAFIKDYGYDYLSEIEGEVEKKAEPNKKIKSSFYQELKKKLQEYIEREKIEHIIIASPAFFKDNLFKELPPKIQKKCTLATCHSFGKNAVEEVIKRPEVQVVLKQERVAKETKLIENLFKHISKQDKSTYGIKETTKAIENNAVKELFISTKYMHKLKQDENPEKYLKFISLLTQAEKHQAEIHLISSEHDAGKKLDGLTGIASILRFNIN